jgi:SAM-dependent methyltransferase
MILEEQLRTIRSKLASEGKHSHTSSKFQDDLIGIIEEFGDLGDSVIEVGCFKGGLTAQLALICEQLGKRLFVIDIDLRNLNLASESVNGAIQGSNVVYHLGDLQSFFNKHGSTIRPSVVFIDGDHRYNGVVADIKACCKTPSPPVTLVFHDFSLRYVTGPFIDVRVDKAIYDTLGENIKLKFIGTLSGSGEVAANEFFHEKGLSEGVAVLFSDISKERIDKLRTP